MNLELKMTQQLMVSLTQLQASQSCREDRPSDLESATNIRKNEGAAALTHQVLAVHGLVHQRNAETLLRRAR